MDIQLSGALDGVQTAERLLLRFDIPVVFLTGRGDDQTLQRSRAADAFGYLLKPVRQEELKAGIETALSRHRTEAHLRTIEHWFSAAIRSISDAVITTDAAGAVTFLNPVAETLTGWKQNSAAGKPLAKVFRVAGESTHQSIDHLLPDLRRGGPWPALPKQMLLASAGGAALPIEANAAPIRDERDGIIGVVLTFRDITARKHSEEALRDSEERFHTFMNNSPVVAFIKDETGRYLFGNRAWAVQFGQGPEALLGKTDFDLWPEETARQFRHSDAAALQSDGPVEFTESGAHPDGSPWHWMVFKFLVRDAAGRRLVGGLALDITERKHAEEALKESRQQLRSLAAHLQSVREEERTRIAREVHDELGQLLTGFKMDLAWLDKRLAGLPEHPVRAPLIDKVKTMSGLIDDMVRSVRKIAAELRPGVLDDLGLVAAMEWQAREFQARTGIECQYTSAVDAAPVNSDICTNVFRIFQETLTNVARHAGASRVTAHLSGGNGQLVLEVRDNGRGVTEAEKLNSHSFGLLGMRERAMMFGGGFQITGAPGQGTTVRVTVPVREG
jgi:PAS domain S-box-containing protein